MGFNVLISSVSKKIPLVKAVRQALNKCRIEGSIIGGDADKRCIGKYFVDQFWEMPPLTDLSSEAFFAACQLYDIQAVIPTRDGELSFFAQHRNEWDGIRVMVSDAEAIEMCLDKYMFYQTLKRLGYPSIETTVSLDELESEKYVVKERYGAGSRSAGIALNRSEAAQHAKKLKKPVFQPWIEGKEISVDLYLEKSRKAKGVVARRREVVVDGESQVTLSFRDVVLERICIEMAEKLNLYGHVMFQLLQDSKKERVYVLECNPRFGGASPLSIAMGLDSFYWFLLEAQGKSLESYPFRRSEREKRLVRYPEDLIVS